MKMSGLALLAPEWLTVWFAVAAAGAFILGFRRAGLALMAWPIIDWVVLPLIEPVVNQLPAWALAAMLVVFGLVMLQGLLSLLFGPEAVGVVVGTYLVRLIDALLMGPFRALRWLFWTLFRG